MSVYFTVLSIFLFVSDCCVEEWTKIIWVVWLVPSFRNGFILKLSKIAAMGRKKIQISRITDERNRQVQVTSKYLQVFILVMFVLIYRWLLTRENLEWWRKPMSYLSCAIARSLWSSSVVVINCINMPVLIWTKSFSSIQSITSPTSRWLTRTLSRYIKTSSNLK